MMLIRVLFSLILISVSYTCYCQEINTIKLSVKIDQEYRDMDLKIFLTPKDCICEDPKCSNCPDFWNFNRLSNKKYKAEIEAGQYNVIVYDGLGNVIEKIENYELVEKDKIKLKFSPR